MDNRNLPDLLSTPPKFHPNFTQNSFTLNFFQKKQNYKALLYKVLRKKTPNTVSFPYFIIDFHFLWCYYIYNNKNNSKQT